MWCRRALNESTEICGHLQHKSAKTAIFSFFLKFQAKGENDGIQKDEVLGKKTVLFSILFRPFSELVWNKASVGYMASKKVCPEMSLPQLFG